MKRKLIVDVDTGVDDAQALMMALSSPDVDVLGITCVNGNVDVDKVCINTLRVLQVCQRLDIPVYRGASKPLVADSIDASHYHGTDGLGDVSDHVAVDTNLIQPDHAVTALIKLINQHPGEITLVAVGPLTNIALALRLQPDLGKHLKEVIIMGGNIHGIGNVTTSAEFNFGVDPEAAFVTLSDLKCPLKLVSWETCTENPLTLDWCNSWMLKDTVKGRFNRDINKKTLELRRIKEQNFYRTCDPVAMTIALKPAALLESEKVYCTLELHGQITRGQMVVDWIGQTGQTPNVEIVKKIDIDIFMELLEKTME